MSSTASASRPRAGAVSGRPSSQAPERSARKVSPVTGAWTTPATTSPSIAAAIETHQGGRPRAKLVVPSIGSTYQTTRPLALSAAFLADDGRVRDLGADARGDRRLGGAVVGGDDVVGVALGR